MSRLVLLALLLTPLCVTADSVYRTTDEQGNVVFTDAPQADGGTVEPVDIQHTNTAQPPPRISSPHLADDSKSEPDVPAYTVAITQPANETSIPMGPGNFSVSVRVSPALTK